MILWKLVEITPEIKQLKGNNYKGRNIGPFIRQCNHCQKNIIECTNYDRLNASERDNVPCKECSKNTKGTLGSYTKECSSSDCQEIIKYKRYGDWYTANKNNTVCKKCVNKGLSERYKDGGLHKYQTKEKQNEIIDKVTKGRKKYYEENPEELKDLIKYRKEKEQK